MTRRANYKRGLVAALSLSVLPAMHAAKAQPAPSFHATCGELRAAVDKLDDKDGELVTIAVEGELTFVGAAGGGTVIYLVMCKPRRCCASPTKPTA